MQPCEQAPTITRVEAKIDKVYDILTTLAVQSEKVNALEEGWDDHEQRIRRLENTPTRIAWWVAGIAATVIAAALVHIMLDGGNV